MSTHYHLTVVSSNEKTGPIPVTTSSEHTCPTACPFKNRGCYAESGPLALHWRKVTEEKRGVVWDEFLEQLRGLKTKGQLVRHNQAGDLPGDRKKINHEQLQQLTLALHEQRGFTYTHYPVLDTDEADATIVLHNRAAVKEANDRGFTVNLSGNDPAHADGLAALGIGPVVTLLPSSTEGRTKGLETPGGRRIVVCPATYLDKVSCSTCRLCAQTDREVIVGFPAHGTGKKKVDATLMAQVPSA